MYSILNETAHIRKGKEGQLDYSNSDRHRVVYRENDGTRTAYCFSTPVYNNSTRKAVDFKFQQTPNTVCADGSNAKITVSSDQLRLENADGFCTLSLPSAFAYNDSRALLCGKDVILPTVNGIFYQAFCEQKREISFRLTLSNPFLSVRANDRCLSLMSERFKPFVTVSCIGGMGAKGKVMSPAEISYQELSGQEYLLTVRPAFSHCQWAAFEISLYEKKLFQDTTVESRRPGTNNAFGSIAFIGNTERFGEQWLYSRLDFLKLSDLSNRRIRRVVLHLPCLNDDPIPLRAYGLSARFCSFGSNWGNRVAATEAVADGSISDNYQSFDFTKLFVDQRQEQLRPCEGFILKPQEKGKGFCVVPTGDSCYAPQILEINFR